MFFARYSSFSALLAVRANDARARQILLRACRQRAEVLLHRLEPRVNGTAQPDSQHGQQNHRRKGQQREAAVYS
jgi:hypothetical protein